MDDVEMVDIDAAYLPVNSSGFGGLRRKPPPDKRDAVALQHEAGFRYLGHNGDGTILVVDRHGRLLIVIGGRPRDKVRWKEEVEDEIVRAIEEGKVGVHFSKKEKKHKRGPFPATAIGVSYGGGEMVSNSCPMQCSN